MWIACCCFSISFFRFYISDPLFPPATTDHHTIYLCVPIHFAFRSDCWREHAGPVNGCMLSYFFQFSCTKAAARPMNSPPFATTLHITLPCFMLLFVCLFCVFIISLKSKIYASFLFALKIRCHLLYNSLVMLSWRRCRRRPRWWRRATQTQPMEEER